MDDRHYSCDVTKLVCAILNKENVKIDLNNADSVMIKIQTENNEVKTISLEDLLRSVASDIKEVL
ncbi:MAG: hypothetical protein N2484_12960 [Clostridia bacterium]|nr:hypothetical protein [Clostridia bacterium]